MIYLFDKDEKLIKIVRKSAVKTALQKYALTTERYVSDRLTTELKGLNADELEQVEYMAIQTMEDAHTFHYFYVAQKSSDELTTLIGVQSGIEELRKSPVYDKRPQNALARDVITDLLAGTNWQARFVGETTPHSTNFYYTSVFDALKNVCEVWDLEMQFFVEMNGSRIGARYIDFKQRIGEAVGKRVVYGHNALQILQEVERTNIYTALVGRGKGEESGDGYGRKITFENVVWSRTQGKPVDKPSGQKYLELPLMTSQYGIKNADGTMRPKIGFADFSEEENPEVLIERTYKALVDAARPQLTLKTSSVYLKGVKVGDTIRVVRHDKKLDYDTRIFEITFNRLNNQSSDIKLGDRIGESNEAKAQKIADKAVEQFVNNEFSNFVQNLPDYLPSADGFNNNWYGAEDPTVKYPGKVLINDIWYKPDPEHEGHKIMLRWTGEVWEEILRTYDSEALRDRIAEEIDAVNTSMQEQSEEHDRQVADILSKTQSIETLANQAKTDAASAITQALLSKDEAIADAQAQVATVSQALNTAKTDLQNQVNAVDAKAEQAQTDVDALEIRANSIADDLLSAKQELSNSVSQIDAKAQTLTADLANSKNDILAQATAQTALKNRVTTVEATANGTKETVTQLSKTVNDLSGEVTSATQSIKTVEDSIDGVYTTLSRIQVGGTNLLNRTRDLYYNGYKANNTSETYQGFTVARGATTGSGYVDIYRQTTNTVADKTDYFITFYAKGAVDGQTIDCHFFNPASTTRAESNQGSVTTAADGKITITLTTTWQRYWIKWTQTASTTAKTVLIGRNYSTDRAYVAMPALFEGNTIRDWSGSLQDSSMEFAEYKQAIDGQLTSLSNSYQTLDGKVAQNTARIETTADGIREDVTSLQSYVDDEGTRRTEYLSASALKTAELIAVERTKTATDYVAKSNYTEDVTTIRRDVSETKTELGSVTDRTKAVEDDLSGTKIQLASAESILNTATGNINVLNSKSATFKTAIDGINNKFDNLRLGGGNLILNSAFPTNTNYWSGQMIVSQHNYYYNGQKKLFLLQTASTAEVTASTNRFEVKRNTDYTISFYVFSSSRVKSSDVWFLGRKSGETDNYTSVNMFIGARKFSPIKAEYVTVTFNSGDNDNGYIRFDNNGSTDGQMAVMYFGEVMLVEGNTPQAHQMADVEISNQIAEYKQNADQNYAGLQSTVSTLDGKVTQNKTEANQTATQLSNRLTSVETYKDGESTRAQSYFEASKTETARQLTAERTAISANYVAKSVYDEDVRGTTLKLNEVKTTADTTKQNLATYQDTVDRKLTELTSSTQTLDGKINTASAKVDTVAGQIRTELATVEGKIPTEVGGRNLALNTSSELSTAWTSFNTNGVPVNITLGKVLTDGLKAGDTIQVYINVLAELQGSNIVMRLQGDGDVTGWSSGAFPISAWRTYTTSGGYTFSYTAIINNDHVRNSYWSARLRIDGATSGWVRHRKFKVERGKVRTDWSPAPDDLINELSSVKTTITQTASGVEQLSTSLSTTNGKVTTAETKINQLISDVSSKVSQTEYNTLTGRVDNAETAITQNATEISKRLTSTQVESVITGKGYQTASQVNTAITGKGYQTKGDVDSNITGRGYITNSALQPYALSTTVQNLVQETAESFSRTISETKALIPTGESNLVKFGRPGETSEYVNAEITTHPLFYNSGLNLYLLKNTSATNEKFVEFNSFSVERNTDYTLYFKGFNNSSLVGTDVWFLKRTRGSTAKFDNDQILIASRKLSTDKCDEVVVTFNTGNFDEGYIRFDNNGSTAEGTPANLYFGDVSVKKGKSNNGWSPSVEELATVTALHNVTDTVDSHTRTIGAVGTSGSILDNVSKVTQTANGLVTEVSGDNGLKTQVSTLAGSYAIKNLTNFGTVLNQLNLNKDGSVKIDGKLVQITGTTYIQDGVISSAKIGSLDAGKIKTGTLDAARIATNSITGSHILFDQAFFNNFTANEAYLKQVFAKNAFITSVQSTDISANLISGGVLKSTNGATNFDLNNGNLLFNNNYGYIRRTANDKIFEITTLLNEKSNYSPESLSSKFMIRKSDSSRQSGVSFDLYTTVDGKPTATTQIYSDSFTITSSDYTTLFSLGSKKSYLGTLNFQDWGDIPVAIMSGGLVVKDIGIGGHTESLLKVVERLCTKTGLIWI
ncbi:TPA: phage tail spike protein [Streptococcus suis]